MSVHDHLKYLSPTAFTDVPTSDGDLTAYIRDTISHCQSLVDSVPPPPEGFAPTSSSSPNVASTGDEVTTNSALTSSHPTPDPASRKAWGKPLKLSAKDNPLHIAVYKMAAADRRGAWFARRSVHEGLGFARWKRALDTEFEDSLKALGQPGEGNVRGIGGEKQLVKKEIPGVGEVGVMLLTAQFPGPSAPRDFVELLISSTSGPEDGFEEIDGERKPRQYLLVSRPVTHPEAPERSGLVRGQYESVEYIREIPVRKTKTVSTTSLPATINGTGPDTSDEKKDEKEQNRDRSRTDTDLINAKAGKISVGDAQATIETNASKGQNLPAEGSKGDTVDVPIDEDGDLDPHPIEWIMITRSDPGGSVPKFLVERGTPGAIVGDASKFLNWATKKEMPVMEEGLDAVSGDEVAAAPTRSAAASVAAQHAHRQSLTRTVTSLSSSSGSSSSDSFVSADSGTPTVTPRATSLNPAADDKYAHQEAELEEKLRSKKARESARLEESKAKYGDSNEQKVQKAEARHERKMQEADNWFEKELGKVQERRAKEERKIKAKERKEREKAESKDMAAQVERLKSENEQMRAELEKLKAAGAQQ